MWFWFWPWIWMGGALETALREGEARDAARMSAIHAGGFAIGWEQIEIERMLAENHVADVLVSRAAFGEIVTGFAISRITLDEAELLSIALDRDIRGRRLSESLLRHHAARLRQQGAETLFLEVAVDNIPAIALYRRLGFVEIGRRKGYYPALEADRIGRRDALAMRWDIRGFDPVPRHM